MLFDTVGTGDLEWSSRLGAAAMELLTLVLRAELAAGRSCVVEANFRRPPPVQAVQVFCTDDPESLAARYRTRTRHPGHLDVQRRPDASEYTPFDLGGPVFEYRIGDDVDALIAQVRHCVL